MALKFCPKCEENIEESDFYTQNGKPHGYCKGCNSKSCKKYYKDNSDGIKRRERKRREDSPEEYRIKHNKSYRKRAKRNPDKMRELRLKNVYKLTIEQFNELLRRQENRCGICKLEFTGKVIPHVDHNHVCCAGLTSCGACIRGLLCSKCNQAIGLFKDNPEVTDNASVYLRRTSDGISNAS